MSLDKIIKDIENVADEKYLEEYFETHESGTLTCINAIFLGGRSIGQPFFMQREASSVEDVDEKLQLIMDIQYQAIVEEERLARLPLIALIIAYQELVKAFISGDENALRSAGTKLGFLERICKANEDFTRCLDLSDDVLAELKAYVEGKAIVSPSELLDNNKREVA